MIKYHINLKLLFIYLIQVLVFTLSIMLFLLTKSLYYLIISAIPLIIMLIQLRQFGIGIVEYDNSKISPVKKSDDSV